MTEILGSGESQAPKSVDVDGVYPDGSKKYGPEKRVIKL